MTTDLLSFRNPQSEIRNSEINYDDLLEPLEFRFNFELDRRSFVQVLGAGVLVTIIAGPALAQEGRRRGGGGGGFNGGPPPTVAARIHVGEDGTLTVLCGKVDGGQARRCEVAMAAAEELRVPLNRVHVILSDTGLTPNDGMTAGSGTTPRTIPSVRQGAAAFRQLLVDHAAREWDAEPTSLDVADGTITDPKSQKSLSYSALATNEELVKQLAAQPPAGIQLAPVAEWKVLGTEQAAPLGRDKITGRHQYPSDIKRPGMTYGAMLRSPSYNGKLVSIDTSPAKAMKDVVAVQDGQFVGVAAPTAFLRRASRRSHRQDRQVGDVSHPASNDLFDYLSNTPKPARSPIRLPTKWQAAPNTCAPELLHRLRPARARSNRARRRRMDRRQADRLDRHAEPVRLPRRSLTRAFHLADDHVRVIVPDFGGGFGGKHTGEAAEEAARLATGGGQTGLAALDARGGVYLGLLPSGRLIEAEASLDDKGALDLLAFHQHQLRRVGAWTRPTASGKTRQPVS